MVIPQVTLEFVFLFELGLWHDPLLHQRQRRGEPMQECRGGAVIHIKPPLRPIRDIGGEVDVEKGDPSAALI
jgi:hypothetical protein